MLKNLNPLVGFEDISGREVLLRGFICKNLEDVYIRNGYSNIEFPLLDYQTLFSTEFVGIHPWPGWHPRSLFSLVVKDFKKGYEEASFKEENMFLIPEGTASVCRFIAKEILENKKENVFPKKYYYITKCFRNELTSQIKDTKKREFTQIGLEYIGEGSVFSDIEIFRLIVQGLNNIGILKKDIIIRYSDVRLFNYLVEKDNINLYRQNRLKEILDNIASERAKKKPITELKKEYIKILKEIGLSTESIELWKILAIDYLKYRDIEKTLKEFPEEIVKSLKKIYELSDQKIRKTLKIDLCVIRGQDYYNKTTFQVDLKTPKGILSEIGGGGRYDHFIKKILSSEDKQYEDIPATGMAYSLERLSSVIKNYYTEEKILNLINGKDGIVLWGQDKSKVIKNMKKYKKEYSIVEIIYSFSKEQSKTYAKSKNFKFKEIK